MRQPPRTREELQECLNEVKQQAKAVQTGLKRLNLVEIAMEQEGWDDLVDLQATLHFTLKYLEEGLYDAAYK